MTTDSIPVEIRWATSRDLPFITSSWLKSFRDGYFARNIPNNVFYHNHHKVLENLLPRCAVLVACNSDDPDQVLGWAAAEIMDGALVLHYIYVKQAFRGWKVARRLWEVLKTDAKVNATVVTHLTKVGKRILKAKSTDDYPIVYNPYILFMSLEEGWQK